MVEPDPKSAQTSSKSEEKEESNAKAAEPTPASDGKDPAETESSNGSSGNNNETASASENTGAALASSVIEQQSLAESVLAAPSLAEQHIADDDKAKDGNAKNESPPPAADKAKTLLDQTQHQTIYRLLDEALQEAPPPRTPPEGGRAYIHPILLDMILAAGLLVAMAGFTIGLLKIYITHSAEQSITQRNFRAAIVILRGAPLPGLFTVPGKDPQELLNQALYLEAMEKLDANSEDESALRELSEIQPGSKFFEFAQEIVKDHTKPSLIQLEGRAQHEASPSDPQIEDNMPVLPPEEKSPGSP